MDRNKGFGIRTLLPVLLAISLFLTACGNMVFAQTTKEEEKTETPFPSYQGAAYEEVSGNRPSFTKEELEKAKTSYESYQELDSLGRCGVAIASIGKDLMPTRERGEIGPVRPTGWHTVKYDFIDGKYLYNRCHLIGYQLSGENANPENLITGTRYLNVEGMLPLENQVADYVRETGNHVLYRVTPIFEGDHALASGVLMEGKSVEDGGKGVCFCVYAFNVQPGVTIHYEDGSNEADGSVALEEKNDQKGTSYRTLTPALTSSKESGGTYVYNKNTGKFHRAGCSSVADMKEKNKEVFASREELTNRHPDAQPCQRCQP